MSHLQGSSIGAPGRESDSAHEAGQRYRAIFQQSMDPIVVIGERGELLDFNTAAHEMLGYTREEFARLNVTDIEARESAAETRAHIERTLATGSDSFATQHRAKDGSIRDVTVATQVLCVDDRRYFLSTFHDLTEQKKTVAALERKSIALQELLDQMQHQSRQFGTQIMANVESIILPMVRDLQRILPTAEQHRAALLAEALEDLTAPFAATLSGDLAHLTPVEIRICRLLRSGMSTKEVAEVQHLSPATVSKHRENIRRKLGITGTDVNLVTHLNTLLLKGESR